MIIILLVSSLAASPIPIPSPPTGVLRGEACPITVQLLDQNGEPIPDATVLFFHETHNEFLGAIVTNSTGHAQFEWQIPVSHELGLVNLNATFRGDPERYLLPSKVSIPLTIFAQLQQNITLKDSTGTPIGPLVIIGQRLFFHVLVFDDLITPAEGIQVQLIMNRTQIITQGITAQNGSLILKCTLNQTYSNAVVFTIRSLNHNYYNGTESSVWLIVANTSVYFIGIPAFWCPWKKDSFNGRLRRISGENVSNVSIDLLSQKRAILLTNRTGLDGEFSFSLANELELIENNRFLILRYNGTFGYHAVEAVIGLVPDSAINPFSQIVEIISSTGSPTLLHQISIIAISCITLTITLIALRLRRATRRIVST